MLAMYGIIGLRLVLLGVIVIFAVIVGWRIIEGHK